MLHQSAQRQRDLQSGRKLSQSTKPRPAMATEYQERYLPPCQISLVSALKRRDPFHPLKGTSKDTATYGSYIMAKKWVKKPTKLVQPSVPVKAPRISTSAPQNCILHDVNNAVKTDYTTVYKNDYRAWKAKKPQPYKLHDNMKVKQGLVATNSPNTEERRRKAAMQEGANFEVAQAVPEPQPQPFESVTSYRADYVTHPLPPRFTRVKHIYQGGKGLPSEPEMAFQSKVAWEDGAGELFQQFEAWTIETKYDNQGKPKRSGENGENGGHECRGPKALPFMQLYDESKEPFQGSTIMREDYKPWEMAKRLRNGKQEQDGTSKSGEGSKSKSSGSHPKVAQTTICFSTFNKKNPSGEENGAFSNSDWISGGEEIRMSWTTALDRDVPWKPM